MTPDTEQIRIRREEGGEVEVTGSIDAFASDVLRRAGFRFEPTLRSVWIRLPFDLGRDWENEHATWATEMLTAARYPVDLDPDLRPRAGESAGPGVGARPPTLNTHAAPSRPSRH
ncbi:hypothetical protein [Streptomyces hokutonensis]|uniref:hypothetical protein n=1 Tax=Streptomyces hokutonensis TaxID=1306990 RepID=UPI0037F24694